jgi:hypothetical protein
MQLLRTVQYAILQDPRRISDDDFQGRDIFENNRARTDHGSPPDPHSRTDKRASSNPNIVLNKYRLAHKRVIGGSVVMSSAAEIHVLGNHYAASDSYAAEVIEDHTAADGHV